MRFSPRQRPRRVAPSGAGLMLALVCAASSAPLAAETGGAVEAGRHWAEAESVAKFCPGGKKTPKADELAAKYAGPDRTAFDAEATKVKDVWAQAMGCKEADDTGRMNEQCRRLKKAFCGHAWSEIGPDGKAIPGLIEFKPD